MHIADGVLSAPVMLVANALAAGGVLWGARRIGYEQVPRVGMMAAVFFIASFIHVHIGPSSAHLLLNGLVGILLGVAALPALGVALLLQSVLMGFGGVSAWGANVLGMGLPAVITGWIFASACRRAAVPARAAGWGALAGASSIALTCAVFALLLHVSDPQGYAVAVKALLLAHIPIAVIEAVVVGAATGFLVRVRPDLLAAPVADPEMEKA